MSKFRFMRLVFAGLIAGIVGFSGISFAEEGVLEIGEEEVLEIGEVVVTATRAPINVWEVPAAIGVVTAEDIRLRARTATFHDAIRNVPGVNVEGVRTMGASDMRIRGRRPAIMVGGRDMNPFMSTFIFNPRNIGMGAIDRIEVLRGPQAAIHGSKAVSGVVNVILRRGDKDHPFMETRFFFGEGDEISGGLSLGGGYDKFSYFLDISAAAQDEYKTPRGTIPFVDYKQQNIYARFDYAFFDGHEITFELKYNDSKNTMGGVGHHYEPHPRNAIWANNAKFQGVFLSYSGDFTNWFSLYASLGIAQNEVGFIFARPNYEPERFLNRENIIDHTEDILLGEIRGTFDLLPDDRLRTTVGLQYKRTDLASYSSRTRGGVRFTSYEWDKVETYWAPYVHAEFRPLPHALIVGGVRYDSFDTAGKKESRFSPNIGLSLFPFAHTDYNWTTIWGSYSEAFRTPFAAERYLPGWLGGNPDLKSEKSAGWEIGLKQAIGLWANLEFSYFETDYKDLIHLERIEFMNWDLLNIGEAKYKGYELLLEIYPTDWLAFHFGYADLDRTDEITGQSLYGLPGQIFQYGLTVSNLYGFCFSVWGKQRSDYKIRVGGEVTNHPSDDDIIWDTKLLYSWNVTERAVLEPFVSIENLTDEKYFGPAKHIREGRAWHIGASLKVVSF